MVVVYLPSEADLAGRTGGPGESAGDAVVAALDTLGVPVLDLRGALRAFGRARDLYAFEQSHFNARGHAAVGALVLRYLEENDGARARRQRPESGRR